MYAGRLSEEKGVDILIDVAKLLPEIKFVVAGMGEMELPKLPNLEYVGYKNQQELAELYNTAKVFFFPSVWDEVCPMVLLEAGIHKVPVVASRVGGVPEIVKENETGFLFDSRSPEAALEAAALIKRIYEDDSLAASMGKQASLNVLTKYDKSSHLNELVNLYTSLISNKNRQL